MFGKPLVPGGAKSPAGMEMMFRSLGLGSVLDAALAFAQGGGVQKITEFADALPEINARLNRIEENTRRLLELAGEPIDVAPGSGSAVSGVGASGDAGASDADQPLGRSGGRRQSNGAAHT